MKAERNAMRSLHDTVGGSDGEAAVHKFQDTAAAIDGPRSAAVVLTGDAARAAQAGDADDDSDSAVSDGKTHGHGGAFDSDSEDGGVGALGGESDEEEAAAGATVQAEGEEAGGYDHSAVGTQDAALPVSEGQSLSSKYAQAQPRPSAAERKPAAKAVPIVPFNLKADREEGYFDAAGDFKWRVTKEEDEWLSSVDQQAATADEDELASQHASAAKAAAARAEAAMGGEVAESMHPYTALAWLGRFMTEEDASVAALLRRVGKLASVGDTPEAGQWKSALESLMTACDSLLKEGALDIYNYTPEQLQSKLQKAAQMYAASSATEGGSAAAASMDADAIPWLYRWGEGGGSEDGHHGPFTSTQMHAWVTAGYFKDQPVQVRRVSNPCLRSTAQVGGAAPAGADGDGGLLDDLDDDGDATLSQTEERVHDPAWCDPEGKWRPVASVDFRKLAAKE